MMTKPLSSMKMTTDVETYLEIGCGRCALGGTSKCKVNRWVDELKFLRNIILTTGLTEESKWGVPCYTYKEANIAVLSAFKEYVSLSFFKGALLQDENNLLQKPGENTQSARLLKFTSVDEIRLIEDQIKTFLFEAIDIEERGQKVVFKQEEIAYPEELIQKLNEMPELQSAFEALTPGRKKSYLLHFSSAKQSKTKISRIEKSIPKIFAGKGFNEY